MGLRKTKMQGWYEFYRGEACPICHKSGACMISEKGDAVVCIRVESSTVFSVKFMSWVHPLGEKRKIENVDMNNVKSHKKKKAPILDIVNRAFLKELVINKTHQVHLKDRGISEEVMLLRGYRSLPERATEVVENMRKNNHFSQLKGIPGFYSTDKGWSVAGNNGFLVPYRNEYNHIIGFQYRLDNPLPKMKYVWLSSAKKENGTAVGDPLPVHVALPCQQLLEKENEKNASVIKRDAVWITEGALKADLIADGLSKLMLPEYTDFLGTTVLGMSGVNCWNSMLPLLESMGVKRITLAIDMDVLENEFVALAFNTMLETLKEKEYEIYIAVWDIEMGKGLDDLLQKGAVPSVGKCNILNAIK